MLRCLLWLKLPYSSSNPVSSRLYRKKKKFLYFTGESHRVCRWCFNSSSLVKLQYVRRPIFIFESEVTIESAGKHGVSQWKQNAVRYAMIFLKYIRVSFKSILSVRNWENHDRNRCHIGFENFWTISASLLIFSSKVFLWYKRLRVWDGHRYPKQGSFPKRRFMHHCRLQCGENPTSFLACLLFGI